MDKKSIENYIVNEKLDLDKIVDDYSSYVKTIINNADGNNSMKNIYELIDNSMSDETLMRKSIDYEAWF